MAGLESTSSPPETISHTRRISDRESFRRLLPTTPDVRPSSQGRETVGAATGRAPVSVDRGDAPPPPPPPQQTADYSLADQPMVDEGRAAPDTSDVYREKVSLSGVSEIEPLHRTAEFADEMLSDAGFSPPVTTPNPDHVYELPSDSVDALGFKPAAGEFQKKTLEEDLWLAQYYDGSKDPGNGRSLEWWRPINPSEIPDLALASKADQAQEHSALLPDWGPRTHVQVACIPAGTEISRIESKSAPQADEHLTDLLKAPDDPATGQLRPELQPDRILETTADVRLGGDNEIRFGRFDERWIRGQREL